MKNEWTMTDEEWEDSLAREVEEREAEQILNKSTKEFEQIWDEIEKEYGY